MCYRTQINASIKQIAKRFNANATSDADILLGNEINGFTHPATPIITNEAPTIIATQYHWGLIPNFAKDNTIRKNTLNARIETLDEKPAFREALQNRCLVIATGYYDWHWNDEQGKTKQKYLIHSANNEIFAFAGIYTTWTDPQTSEIIKSYAIVTSPANKTMAYIHNSKLRMPVMLNKGDEAAWLDSSNSHANFAFPKYDATLLAFPVN